LSALELRLRRVVGWFVVRAVVEVAMGGRMRGGLEESGAVEGAMRFCLLGIPG